MAKGRPDWTVSINITGQDHPEVVERPKYGAAKSAYHLEVTPEDSTEVIVSIAGTGMIYGGAIRVYTSANPAYVRITPSIDGEIITSPNLVSINTYQISEPNMWCIYETYYSTINNMYVYGITRGITFEESYVLTLANEIGSGSSVIDYSQILFALI